MVQWLIGCTWHFLLSLCVLPSTPLQDSFTLVDTEKGQIQLGLFWQTVYFNDT
jgi:hypothetical protein